MCEESAARWAEEAQSFGQLASRIRDTNDLNLLADARRRQERAAAIAGNSAAEAATIRALQNAPPPSFSPDRNALATWYLPPDLIPAANPIPPLYETLFNEGTREALQWVNQNPEILNKFIELFPSLQQLLDEAENLDLNAYGDFLAEIITLLPPAVSWIIREVGRQLLLVEPPPSFRTIVMLTETLARLDEGIKKKAYRP